VCRCNLYDNMTTGYSIGGVQNLVPALRRLWEDPGCGCLVHRIVLSLNPSHRMLPFLLTKLFACA
jgi:hypothetical protein